MKRIGLSSIGGILGVFVCVTPVPEAAAQGGPLETLRGRYPEVMTLETGGRVRTVYGARMTAGDTAREAAEAWLALYDGVFAGGWLDLEERRAMPLSGGERTVFMYRQRMDGLPVLGTSVRVLTLGHAPPRTVYAGARVAIRPDGGLPEPTVAPARAVAAARAHPMAEGLANWSEPDQVAIYDDAPAGDGVAYPVWRCVGTRARPYDSRTFYIDAVTGAVARHHSNIMHAMEITGTVSGKATPADTNSSPEALGPDTFTLTTNCPNDEETVTPRDLLIEAFQGTTLIASGSTGADGTYALLVQNQVTVDVHASLIGPAWEVLDGSEETWGEPIDPLVVTNVTAPASGVNFSFNSTPTEAGTAFMNAHVSMARTWEYLGLATDLVPSVPVVVHSVNVENGCNAFWVAPAGGADDPPWPGVIQFFQSRTGQYTCPNTAFSTILAHEYGHFIAHYLLDIENVGWETNGFHEGFGDVLGHLAFDTEVMGQDIGGCGTHIRVPRDPTNDPEFPVCSLLSYERGMLLSALWLDILEVLGVADTRTLYRDWTGLAQLPEAVTCTGFPVTVPQAADEGTLIEILTADSPDGNPANAEHLEEICFEFDERGISTGVCPESAGWLYVDCDRSGALDLFDFLCFQNKFAAGVRYADCDHDRNLTILDFVCFQKQFEANR